MRRQDNKMQEHHFMNKSGDLESESKQLPEYKIKEDWEYR